MCGVLSCGCWDTAHITGYCGLFFSYCFYAHFFHVQESIVLSWTSLLCTLILCNSSRAFLAPSSYLKLFLAHSSRALSFPAHSSQFTHFLYFAQSSFAVFFSGFSPNINPSLAHSSNALLTVPHSFHPLVTLLLCTHLFSTLYFTVSISVLLLLVLCTFFFCIFLYFLCTPLLCTRLSCTSICTVYSHNSFFFAHVGLLCVWMNEWMNIVTFITTCIDQHISWSSSVSSQNTFPKHFISWDLPTSLIGREFSSIPRLTTGWNRQINNETCITT